MKNKRKTLFTILISFVALTLIIITAFLIRGKTYNLKLEQLKQEEEYQFDALAWNMSFEEVNRKLPYSLTVDEGRIPAPEGMAFYNSKRVYDLYGKQAVASFEFHSDALKIIQFDFDLDENYEAWFDKLVTELTNLYGPESDKKENAGENVLGQFHSIVYTWETEHTMLQITLSTGNKISPNGMIGLAIK